MQHLLHAEALDKIDNPNPEELKYLLCPVLANSHEQQLKFYRIFDEYYAAEQTRIARLENKGRETSHQSAVEEQKDAIRKQSIPQWLVMLIAAGLIGLLIVVYFLAASRPTIPKAKFSIVNGEQERYSEETQEIPEGDMLEAQGVIGDSISFHFEAEEDTTGMSIVELIWLYGDGRIDTIRNLHRQWPLKPQYHIYNQIYDKDSNFYEVQLIVRHPSNPKVKATVMKARINLECRKPIQAKIAWEPKEPKESVDIAFGSPVDSIRENDMFSYAWDFGDGNTSSAQEPRHQYAKEGDYKIQLEIIRVSPSEYPCQDTARLSRFISISSDKPIIELASEESFQLKKDDSGLLTHNFTLLGIGSVALALTLLLLTLALLYRFLTYQRPSPKQGDKYDTGNKGPYYIPLPNQDGLIAPDRGIYDLAGVMRQRQIGNIQSVNLPASIGRTIREQGMPVIEFDTSSRPSEYLILIEKHHPESHLARFFGRISEILTGEDVLLDTFYYDKDPRTCWNEDYPDGLSLEQMRQRYAKHRLILFSDGYHLINSSKPVLYGWVVPAFEIWRENRILLTPTPVVDWNYREKLIMKEMDVLPLDIPGQMYMIEMFDEIGQPEFEEHKDRMMNMFPAASHSIRKHNLSDVQGVEDYLGPDLFHWLAATAIYPKPRWEITLAMGHSLSQDREDYLLTFENLLILARIPWLQTNDLPSDLRQDLLSSLDPSTEHHARTVLKQLFAKIEADGLLSGNSFAAREMAIQQVSNDFFLEPSNEEVAAEMYYLMEEDMLEDDEIQQRMEEPLEILDGQVSRQYLNNQFARLRRREYVIGGISGLLVFGLLTFFLFLFTGRPSQNLPWIDGTEIEENIWIAQHLEQDSAVIWHNLAVESALLEKLEEAKPQLQQALDYRQKDSLDYALADSNMSKLSYRLGVLRFNEKAYQSALNDFNRVISGTGDELYKRSLGGRGLASYYLNQYEEARRYFVDLMALDSAFAIKEYPDLYAFAFKGEERSDEEAYAYHIGLAEGYMKQQNYSRASLHADSALLYRANDQVASGILADIALSAQQAVEELVGLLDVFVQDTADQEPTAGPFEGHTKSISALAFAPDGQSILTGSEDQTARLWDLQGQEMITFVGHTAPIRSVAFSPDGQYVLTGSLDNTAKLWDLQGQLIQTFAGHTSQVRAVAFSPDMENILTGSYDRTARLWNLDGREIRTFTGHTGEVFTVTFSPDAKYVLTGSRDNTAKLWDLQGREIQTFAGHTSQVRSVSFSPDGQSILTGSSDQTAKLWNLRGEELQSFQGHTSDIWSVVFSPDGQKILTGSHDNTVKVWDLQGQEIQQFGAQNGEVSAIAVSPIGRQVAIASGNTIELRTYSNSTPIAEIPESNTAIPTEMLTAIQQIARDLEAEQIMYDNRGTSLADNSGIFLRVVEALKTTFPAYQYPNSTEQRSSRQMARWYDDQGKLTIIQDPLKSGNLIQPGTVMFYGTSGMETSNLTINQLTQRGGISHVGVVVEVEKDKQGQVSNYTLFHGQRPGKVAARTQYHARTQKIPYGNGSMPWVAVAPIMGQKSKTNASSTYSSRGTLIDSDGTRYTYDWVGDSLAADPWALIPSGYETFGTRGWISYATTHQLSLAKKEGSEFFTHAQRITGKSSLAAVMSAIHQGCGYYLLCPGGNKDLKYSGGPSEVYYLMFINTELDEIYIGEFLNNTLQEVNKCYVGRKWFEEDPEPYERPYVTGNPVCEVSEEVLHVVQEGETLYQIAKKYDLSIERIRELNQMKSNLVSTGQRLKIEPKTHTVQSGETLYQIAQKYGLSVEEIKQLNQMKSNVVSLGQRLKLK